MFVFRVCIPLIVIVAAAVGPVTSPDAIARSGPRVVSAATSGQWQVLGAAKGQPSFFAPDGVATDAQGNVYVANTGGNSIVKVSRTGQLLATWGTARTSPIQFNTPQGVALDAHGNIYVADTGNGRVVKLSPTGRPLARWGTKGTGPRQLGNPSDVALDTQGNIYVADSGNQRVVKLSPAGAPLAQWNTNVHAPPADETVTVSPVSIAVSVKGTVYVSIVQSVFLTERGTGGGGGGGLQQWSTGGKLLAEWWQVPRSGAFVSPVGRSVAVDGHGDIYTIGWVSTIGDVILKLAPNGTVLAHWHVGRNSLSAIAVDHAGNVYVTEGGDDRVYKVAPSGATLAQWGTSRADAGRFFMPEAIAIDTHNNIYVADTGNKRLQELSPRGLPIATWPEAAPSSVAVDARGTIYLGADLPYLLRKPANADALTPWLSRKIRDVAGQPTYPNALAVDAHGNIYLTVGGGGVGFVEIFSPAGVLLARFRLPRQVGGGVGVAVDRDGNIYVTNPDVPTPIMKFSTTGKLLASWGTIGTKPDQFSAAAGIAIDHQGNIYVADAGSNRIHELSPQGKQLAVWGTAGSEPGQFHQPVGVAVDSQDNLYVLDAGNNRIQELPAGH